MKNCGITDDAPAKKDAIHMQYIFGETDESGIKLQTEGGFTRKKLGKNCLQRGERGEKRKRILRGK